MEKIRFLHIPKTAGSSFTECLRLIYHKGKHFQFVGDTQSDLDRYAQYDTQNRKRLSLISGHSPRITGDPNIDSFPTIIFLRNPVDRVKSFCQHVSEGKSAYLLGRFPPDRFDLNEFIGSGVGELSNLQTTMLLGEKNYILPEDNTATLLEKALGVLENNLLCFGITEEFDNSLMLFHYKLGWRQWPVYQKLNKKNKFRAITFNDNQIAKIQALNKIDIQVYEKSISLFKNRIGEIAGNIEENLNVFKRYQKTARIFIFPLLNQILKFRKLARRKQTAA